MELLSNEEYLALQCRMFNAEPGKLRGYDCPECRNRGYIAVADEGRFVVRECRCLARREVLKKLASSGITRFHSFDEFVTNTPWREKLKAKAEEFCDIGGEWFFIGGQSGCGKTHLCTAILSYFLDRGLGGKYFLWREDSVRLKANLNESTYEQMIGEFKRAPVLYIDDLFKTKSGEAPTAGDVNLAFELLNARYVSGKTTIISSERTLPQVLEVDEAVGSRIYERAKGFCLNVSKGKDKNWRLNR